MRSVLILGFCGWGDGLRFTVYGFRFTVYGLVPAALGRAIGSVGACDWVGWLGFPGSGFRVPGSGFRFTGWVRPGWVGLRVRGVGLVIA